MQPVSELYLRLLANPEHLREIKVNLAGAEYGKNEISSCSTTGGVVPDLTVGGCISRDLGLVIESAAKPPRAAKILLFSRLTMGDESSEWIPAGVYYVDTRSYDEVSGRLTLKGYDAMRRAEEIWWDPSEDMGEWPMLQTEAVADIVKLMEVQLDPRSRIGPALMAEYPNDLTMREALGHIAAANGGNWSMTGDGKLLLTPLGGLPPETSLLVDGGDGRAILFGEVRICLTKSM